MMYVVNFYFAKKRLSRVPKAIDTVRDDRAYKFGYSYIKIL